MGSSVLCESCVGVAPECVDTAPGWLLHRTALWVRCAWRNCIWPRLLGDVRVRLSAPSLHECDEQSRKYGIIYIFSLFCEYTNLEYVQVPVIYRLNQAGYVIHTRVAASQEYVNTYSTRRAPRLHKSCRGAF